MTNSHTKEIESGQRFRFGKNWAAFLASLDENRIREAERSLREMLGVKDLVDKRFLDMGSGSGLFSLAARRLGATVHSFDFDPESVACTGALRERYFPGDENWTVEEGSVLDRDYVVSLGTHDIVYSWGVLHHTGDMARALDHAVLPLAEEGQLYIAIYNDQGVASRIWRAIKRTYCASGPGRLLVTCTCVPFLATRGIAAGLVKHGNPFGYFANYRRKRGMSIHRDWIDWLGGYPFEVAKPEEIFHRFRDLGFALENLSTTNRHGCTEFVFRKTAG